MEQIACITDLIIRQVPKENIVSCEVETQSFFSSVKAGKRKRQLERRRTIVTHLDLFQHKTRLLRRTLMPSVVI